MKRKIGNVEIENPFILAPMAGVNDLAYRKICKDFGAGLTVSEMVSSKALSFSDKKTYKLAKKADNENPFSLQIFGHEADIMANAASELSPHCHILDINMGCPAPKITSNGDGSAMMLDIKNAEKVILAVVKASQVPVTVKFRLGFNRDNINCIDFAKMVEASGASAICVHGRTREQMYSGTADWDMLSKVRQAVTIPFIANGDVYSAIDAKNIMDKTAADFVMIGRGALGNPFIFTQCMEYFTSGQIITKPTFEDKIQTALKHLNIAVLEKGEKIAMLEARKHLIWYLKGTAGAKGFKDKISKISTTDDLNAICSELLTAYKNFHREV